MLASSIPYKFSYPWASSAGGSYVTASIPATATGAAASQALGFPPITATDPGAGGVPPNIADMNGAMYYATLWAQWQQAGSPVRYDGTFSTAIGGYPAGAVLASTTPGVSWVSTADNNTANPDSGGANWLRQPPGPATGEVTVTTNTTLTAANWGQIIAVLASVAVTTPAASAVPGMPLSFVFSAGCSLTLGGGLFVGGSISGSGSINPAPANSFLTIRSDGTSWVVVVASPDILGFATVSALTSEANTRASADSAEATTRAAQDALRALLAGSSSQVFSVAAGTSGAQAIRYDQFLFAFLGSNLGYVVKRPDALVKNAVSGSISYSTGGVTTAINYAQAFGTTAGAPMVCQIGTPVPGVTLAATAGLTSVSITAISAAGSGTVDISCWVEGY